ncbi:MFS transporter, partial [Pseudomonas piscis]|uniref:MFS transporter n=1 Tax=Pseudomonas piscis TaxID=2614538 RepID=UPI0003B362CD
GQLADRGLAQWTSGLALGLMLLCWIPIGLTQWSLWALLVGVIGLDLGLQAVHVTSQSLIYSVRPEAQSRLAAGYMLFYSIGSAAGSIAATSTYPWAGWTGVCLLGAGINAIALGYWLWSLVPQRPRASQPCPLESA